MFSGIRNGLKFSRSPLHFLAETRASYGDYHVARLGFHTAHLIFDPTISRLVLSDPLSFIKTRFVYDKIKPITGEFGLVQIEGEPGLKLRAAFNEFFKPAALDSYLARAEEMVGAAISEFEGVHNVPDMLTELVLQTAVSMFAGVTRGTDSELLSKTFLRLNDLCSKQFKNLLPFPHPLRGFKIKQVKKVLDRVIGELIRNNTQRDCLIGFIRASEATIPMKVTDAFLGDQLKTFIFAGHETTATYLIMAIYELARNPELQEMVYRECVSQDHEETTTKRFLREILRLYSPAWMIVRESVGSGELEGHAYRRGDFFILGVHQMHRHPAHWQCPEQLSLSNQEKANPAFMPYGHGRRHCIGSRLADLELQMILSMILKRYRLEYRGSTNPVRPKVMITAYPADPVHVEFIRRTEQ